MDVMVLKHRLKSVQPLHDHSDGELSTEEQEQEMAIIMGGHLDDEVRDRELKAHTDRIKILEAELQKARAEAYQAGYQEGQNTAKAEARKQFNQMNVEFSSNINAIHTEFDDKLEHLSEPLLKLALGAAEKVIQRELSIDDRANEILLDQVRRVLNETVTQTRAVVQVNVSQLEWITGSAILKSLNAPQKGNLRFIPNPELRPGECKLETEDYLIDSTIRAQLDNMEKVLIESDAATT